MEKVEPAEPFGRKVFRVGEPAGEFADSDRRGVRKEKFFAGAEPVEIAVELPFHLRFFDNRLQDDFGAVQVRRLAGHGKEGLDPAARFGPVVRLRRGASRELAGELKAQAFGRGGARLGRKVVEENGNPGAQKRGGNGTSHQAAAGDSERCGRRCH